MTTKKEYYVYVYFDPDTRRPIYVGKGRGNRALHHMHLMDEGSPKTQAIQEILDEGKKPIIQIVQWGLTEEQAFTTEAALIECFGLRALTNKRRGKGVSKINADFLAYILNEGKFRMKCFGRHYVLFLNVTSKCRPGMTAFELYDAIRGPWTIDLKHARDCNYIFCLLNGYVIEIYQNVEWFEYGRSTRQCVCKKDAIGYEFMARRASQVMRNRYVGKKLAGSASPRLRYLTYGYID